MAADIPPIERRSLESRQSILAFRCMADGVILIDAVGGITLMNPAGESLTGWKFGEARGQALTSIFQITYGDARPCSDPLAEFLDRDVSMNARLVTKARPEFSAEGTMSPMRDTDGTLRGMVLTFRRIGKRYGWTEETYREMEDVSMDDVVRDVISDLRK